MHDGSEVSSEHYLVKCDLHRGFVLNVADTAVGENVPLDLKFAKLLLDLAHYLLHSMRFTRELEIIDMLRHAGGQTTTVMSDNKLVVDLARKESAQYSSLPKLYRECTRGIAKTFARFVTMEHFGLRVETLKPGIIRRSAMLSAGK